MMTANRVMEIMSMNHKQREKAINKLSINDLIVFDKVTRFLTLTNERGGK